MLNPKAAPEDTPQELLYNYTVPATHMPGVVWYHVRGGCPLVLPTAINLPAAAPVTLHACQYLVPILCVVAARLAPCQYFPGEDADQYAPRSTAS